MSPVPRKNQGNQPPGDPGIRLQKVLAQAGHGSRRQCEQLIVEGRVTIDGVVASELGVRVDPDRHKVAVDGSRVRPVRHQYFMVNKPPGVVSTSADPAGRLRVIDLIPTDQRLYNVGRLDKSSEGLILVTNDGELANQLTHPRYGVPKTYWVTVAGNPRWEELQDLKKGVRLAEGTARVTEIRIRKRGRKSCELQIVLDEGRNREIRRLLARIGHKVTRLRRVAIGPLHLDELPAGASRRLEAREIAALKRAPGGISSPRTRVTRPAGQTDRQPAGSGRRQKTSSSPGRRQRQAAGTGQPATRRKATKKKIHSGQAGAAATRAGQSGRPKAAQKKPVTRAQKKRRTPR